MWVIKELKGATTELERAQLVSYLNKNNTTTHLSFGTKNDGTHAIYPKIKKKTMTYTFIINCGKF